MPYGQQVRPRIFEELALRGRYVTLIKLIGEKNVIIREFFDKYNESCHSVNQQNEVINYFAEDTMTITELEEVLIEKKRIALPISLIQSKNYYQQFKKLLKTNNAQVKWVNTLAIHPHFKAITEQISETKFHDIAINRISLTSNQNDKQYTITQRLLEFYIWLESTMSKVDSITAIKREKEDKLIYVLSLHHKKGTITNAQLVYSKDYEHVEIEVTGSKGMLVQQKESDEGAVVFSNGKRDVLDSLISKKKSHNLWKEIYQLCDINDQDKKIERALSIIEATEKSLVKPMPILVKEVSDS